MILKPPDVVILLKLVALGNVDWSFSPLYKSVPKAAGQGRQLYELLVLTDARQRKRKIAVKEISKRLKGYNDSKS